MSGRAPLERAVEVMDRLRSPGGCPWDAEQTHASLTRYLVEECYEVLEAIDNDDPVLLREELGDLLLQVLFHARIAAERPVGAFGIDEVAGDLADKLVRRHPHVFDAGTDGPRTAEQLNETWEQQKIAEKGRTSALDGVPVAQPALALAAKLVSRANRAGLADAVGPATSDHSDAEAIVGEQLLSVVRVAVTAGVDPETALRRRVGAVRRAISVAESDPAPDS